MLALSPLATLLVLAANVFQPTYASASPRPGNFWIVGDSTAAWFDPVTSPKWGWGMTIGQYVNLTIQNKAQSGRSCRSYVREGWWNDTISGVQKNDWVIIEMGHNDSKNDTRAPLPGTGNETLFNVTEGVPEIIRTYPGYLRYFTSEIRAKGATPIIFSRVTRISPAWVKEDPPAIIGPAEEDIYVQYALDTAKEVHALSVDQHESTQEWWQAYGYNKTKTFFVDNTHTTPAGSYELAQAILVGMLRNKKIGIDKYLTAAGKAVAKAHNC